MDRKDEIYGPIKGMTLRDYFAGQALVGIITHPGGKAGDWEGAAEDAYESSDAMLEERNYE